MGYDLIEPVLYINPRFVKLKDDDENDLATYCTREGIRHVLFQNFSQALPIVRAIVEDGKTVQDVLLSAGK